MAGIDFGRLDALTFDCYGTLIDWERGLLSTLWPVLDRRGVRTPNDALLEAFARFESELEAGEYQRYRKVLAGSFRGICATFGIEPLDEEVEAFAASVGDWPAFEDSAGALARLSERFRLGVITNCDDDLFAASNARLGVAFDWVVTAEQVHSYKPSARNFEVALERIGAPPERVLHVAQSLYHDHVPARRLGLRTAWIDRRRGRAGSGATPTASASPDVVEPDLRTFADLALGGPDRPPATAGSG